MGGLGVSGGMAWTVRTDFLEVWRDWSYMAWGKSIFMFDQHEPTSITNFLSDFFLYFPETWNISQHRHFLTKWLPSFLIFHEFSMEAAGAADKILMDAKAESPGCLKAAW